MWNERVIPGLDSLSGEFASVALSGETLSTDCRTVTWPFSSLGCRGILEGGEGAFRFVLLKDEFPTDVLLSEPVLMMSVPQGLLSFSSTLAAFTRHEAGLSWMRARSWGSL